MLQTGTQLVQPRCSYRVLLFCAVEGAAGRCNSEQASVTLAQKADSTFMQLVDAALVQRAGTILMHQADPALLQPVVAPLMKL
jgi:hypothetical protein